MELDTCLSLLSTQYVQTAKAAQCAKAEQLEKAHVLCVTPLPPQHSSLFSDCVMQILRKLY